MRKIFNIDLDEKTKIIIITFAIAFITVFICFSITRYRIRKRHDMNLKIAQESKKLVLRGDIEKIEAKRNEYVKYFYDTMDQENFRLIVSGLAREAGVEIVSIKPFGRAKIEDILKVSLSISLRCTYSELVEFIAKIEKLPEIMKIEELSVKGLSDFAARGKVEKSEPIESDKKATVLLIVAAYSVKR